MSQRTAKLDQAHVGSIARGLGSRLQRVRGHIADALGRLEFRFADAQADDIVPGADDVKEIANARTGHFPNQLRNAHFI